MRLLIAFAALLLPFAAEARSAVAQVPAKHFYLELRHHHGGEWFKVYRKDGKWICRTESNPRFVAKQNPLAELDWKTLKQEPSECRTTVSIVDARVTPAKKATGCSDQPSFKALIKRLNASCRVGG